MVEVRCSFCGRTFSAKAGNKLACRREECRAAQQQRRDAQNAAYLHSPIAAENPRAFPLWDGNETVESYAAKVNLPATKSIDLGGGVKMHLVLIPAGQFIMGSAEPERPAITVAGSKWLFGVGSVSLFALLLVLGIKNVRSRKLSFSLRWLIVFSIAAALVVGGALRWQLAIKQAEKCASDKVAYDQSLKDEKPAHSVTLTRPFYMGKYTVTQARSIKCW